MRICDDEKCTGCGACANVCPKSCITMDYNARLELAPVAGENCIECGKCQKVCPVSQEDQWKNTTQVCYAAYSHSRRATGSSGGIASALAGYFIQNADYVCGSIFDGDVHHVVTSDMDIANKMSGSKYVQSRTGSCYQEIDALCKTKKCLFVGTPCQVAAVRAVVKNTANLYCVDLICHGTPSPKYLAEVLQETKECKTLSFRNKGIFAVRVNGETSEKGERYILSFLNGMTFRESCYVCQYAQEKRTGDITLGDFWEIKKFAEHDKGVSCVLVNTPKGQEMLHWIEHDLYLEERNVEEAYFGNPQLQRPSAKHRNRDNFLKELRNTGSFDRAVKPNIKKERFKNWLKKFAVVQWLLALKNKI